MLNILIVFEEILGGLIFGLVYFFRLKSSTFFLKSDVMSHN